MTKIHLIGSATGLCLAVALAACTPPASDKLAAADTSAVATAVKADADQAIADFNAHDATKMASHSAPDAVHMFHGNANTTGTDEAGLKKTLTDLPDIHVTLADETVDVATAGDMAVFRSTYTTTLTDPKTKKPVTDKGNYLAGYKKQADGSWKQEWTVVSDFGPPPAAAPAAKS